MAALIALGMVFAYYRGASMLEHRFHYPRADLRCAWLGQPHLDQSRALSGATPPHWQHGAMPVHAVLFDFSGTLFRLEEDDRWFAGMELIDEDGRRAVDEHAQAELMERLTHPPTGGSVTRTEEAQRAWVNRDLAPPLCTGRPTCTR